MSLVAVAMLAHSAGSGQAESRPQSRCI